MYPTVLLYLDQGVMANILTLSSSDAKSSSSIPIICVLLGLVDITIEF